MVVLSVRHRCPAPPAGSVPGAGLSLGTALLASLQKRRGAASCAARRPAEGAHVRVQGLCPHAAVPWACSAFHLPTFCCWQHFLWEPRSPVWTGGIQVRHLDHGQLWVFPELSCFVAHAPAPLLCQTLENACSCAPHPSSTPSHGSFSSDPIRALRAPPPQKNWPQGIEAPAPGCLSCSVTTNSICYPVCSKGPHEEGELLCP